MLTAGRIGRKWWILAGLAAAFVVTVLVGRFRPQEESPEAKAQRLVAELRGAEPTGPDKWLIRFGLKKEQKERRRTLHGELVALGEVAVPPLIEALGDSDDFVGLEAAVVLVKIGPKAVPGLVQAMKGRDETVRYKAVWALRHMAAECEEVVPALIQALDDDMSDVREEAARGISESLVVPDKEAVASLIRALKDDSCFVRKFAALALGKVDSDSTERVVPHLIQALKDRNYWVREAAAQALGDIALPAEGVVPALREALNDKEEDVRKAAAEALENIQQDRNEPTTATATTQATRGP